MTRSLFSGGNLLYLTKKLVKDPMTLECQDRSGNEYVIHLVHTKETIKITDSSAMKLLNIILRRAMGCLDLQLVGRNLYDAKQKVSEFFLTEL